MADSPISIKADISHVTAFLERMKANAEQTGTLLKAVALYHVRQSIRVFESEGRGFKALPSAFVNPSDLPWKGFAKGSLGRTRPSGQKITESSKLLQDTGTLRQSIKPLFLAAKVALYGTNLSYAGQHHFGNKAQNLPARPFLFFTQADIDKVEQLGKTFMEEDVLRISV